MDLFYALPEDCSSAVVTLRNDECHHLVRVMRAQTGDEVMVTDGAGNLYVTRLEQVRHDIAVLKVVGIKNGYNEPSLRITVAIGMLKNPSRMEYAIEKCTEVGVAGFIPLNTTRVIPHTAKIQRWKGIAIAAMKQSCRTIVPEIHAIQKFDDAVAAADGYDLKLVAHEAEDRASTIESAIRNMPDLKSALLCIGPEGGFTEEEVDEAGSAGFISVSLGPRRLRTETAAVIGACRLLLE